MSSTGQLDSHRSDLQPSRISHRSAFLFGDNISHSLSPVLHKAVFEQLYPSETSSFDFTLLDTPDVKPFCSALHENRFCIGASITIPHKLSALKVVNELSEEARVIGAVNTVYFRQGPRPSIDEKTTLPTKRYVLGTNTDCIGIREALLRKYPRDVIIERVRGESALVIGAGGTARAAVYALWKFFGIEDIYVVNRFEEEANEMIRSLCVNGCKAKMRWIGNFTNLQKPRIVVGTVPDIDAVTQEEKRAKEIVGGLLKLKHPQEDGWLLDMCYNPDPNTQLIREAREVGWKTVSGVDAMCYGSFAQDELWTGKVVDNDVMSRAYKEVWKAANKLHI